MPERERDGGTLRAGEAVRLAAFIIGNRALDLLLGKRWHGQVGCRSFSGEPRKLLGKEGLHCGRAHRLNAVLERLGAAGFHRALDRPVPRRAAIRSGYAGEELLGAGLRRGAGCPRMVPVKAAVEGGLHGSNCAARIVGCDTENAADPVRRGPGQEAREKVRIVLQDVDAVMAPAASDPDRGARPHRRCDSPAFQPFEKLDLRALQFVDRERVGGGFLAENRNDLGTIPIKRRTQVVAEGHCQGGGLRGADAAEVPVLGEVCRERPERSRHRGFGAGKSGNARQVHSDDSSRSRRACREPEFPLSGGLGL